MFCPGPPSSAAAGVRQYYMYNDAEPAEAAGEEGEEEGGAEMQQ